MSGTKIGGMRASETQREKMGEEAYREYLRERGKRGGQVLGVKKGFALRTPEERREFGSIGGKISQRRKVK